MNADTLITRRLALKGQRPCLTAIQYRTLEDERIKRASAYCAHVIDWSKPESIGESGRLHKLFDTVARAMDSQG